MQFSFPHSRQMGHSQSQSISLQQLQYKLYYLVCCLISHPFPHLNKSVLPFLSQSNYGHFPFQLNRTFFFVKFPVRR